MNIANRLKQERRRLEYNQNGFAALAGVTLRAYAEWESGNTSPTAVQLARFAQVGADVQYIVTAIPSAQVLSTDEQILLRAYQRLAHEMKPKALGVIAGLLGEADDVKIALLSAVCGLRKG
ncbi:helix-turn-helix transcriptional regulator [Uliginosibacterium gangwonense]|uniref:helix-turn-helix transcriptional regulator n=1 Tax=Uliginosibacterium gangwonense TaxID=392736 RepID=UPI00039EE59B|nr:helix-turn-helix transcriptional regulator [Uliginosibacterium gangwonense]